MSQLSENALLKAPWLPSQLGALQLWLDGVDVNANSSKTNDGVTVSNWQDKSGLGRNANVQATGTRVYDLQNGSVNFGPGGNARLEIANAAGINLGTTTNKFWAFAFRTNSDLATLRAIYEQGGGTNCFACYTFTDGNLYIGYGNGGAAQYYASFAVTPNTDYVVTFNVDSGAGGHRASLNGVAQTQVNTRVLNQHTGDIAVGSSGGNFRSHTGGNLNATNTHDRHYELFIENSTLSVADVQRVEGYLAWKWGFPTSLPFSHPYRGQRPL